MDTPLLDKSYKFALNIIHVYQKVSSEKKEFILSKPLLRSGTSIGANIEESQGAQSKFFLLQNYIFHIRKQEKPAIG